ncbi:MAG TPA: glycerophosphodiester phosphodiesterase [Dehalococcoidia bacterium]|nr:glycerophosphodiester phosphodiesterase [Dehalococcoidia bacterium]
MQPDDTPAPHARRGYYAIAHRAGNNLHHLEQALAAGVDAIECDFWHASGRLVLRHERKLPALPVLYDRWYLRIAMGELQLPKLLRAIDHRAELFLDIKSASPRAADAVLTLYHDNASMMPRTSVSSRQWKLLDRLAAAATDLRTFYSVGSRSSLAALLRRAESGPRPAGTSIRQTLLTPGAVRQLHDAGLQVYAWTVNNPHRAADLLAWGVDGLIFDDVGLAASLGDRVQR